MAKVDKSQYSKDEWRKIKEQRQRSKDADRFEKSLEEIHHSYEIPKDEKYYILCLKHGKKYSADYVNRLFRGVSRHCTLDFEFVCLTDDPKDILPGVKILPLPSDLQGWWCKPYMYTKDLPLNGTILYLDLDVVIAKNIDKLFTYSPNHWCVIRDFTRAMRPKWPKYNSSVIRFKVGQLNHVWESFKKDRTVIQRKFFGDQDYLYDATHMKTPPMLFPDSWVQSWKWEIRESRELAPGLKGDRKLKHIEHVEPRVECCIAVFHGDPNPHNCEDPWVVKNWQ